MKHMINLFTLLIIALASCNKADTAPAPPEQEGCYYCETQNIRKGGLYTRMGDTLCGMTPSVIAAYEKRMERDSTTHIDSAWQRTTCHLLN